MTATFYFPSIQSKQHIKFYKQTSFPHPEIEENDTIKLNLETNEIESFTKFKVGKIAMITGGNNLGRVGIICKIEKHLDSFNIVHLVDKKGENFATRLSNVFVIGEEGEPLISLPKMKGIRLTCIEERNRSDERKKKLTAA